MPSAWTVRARLVAVMGLAIVLCGGPTASAALGPRTHTAFNRQTARQRVNIRVKRRPAARPGTVTAQRVRAQLRKVRSKARASASAHARFSRRPAKRWTTTRRSSHVRGSFSAQRKTSLSKVKTATNRQRPVTRRR